MSYPNTIHTFTRKTNGTGLSSVVLADHYNDLRQAVLDIQSVLKDTVVIRDSRGGLYRMQALVFSGRNATAHRVSAPYDRPNDSTPLDIEYDIRIDIPTTDPRYEPLMRNYKKIDVVAGSFFNCVVGTANVAAYLHSFGVDPISNGVRVVIRLAAMDYRQDQPPLSAATIDITYYSLLLFLAENKNSGV